MSLRFNLGLNSQTVLVALILCMATSALAAAGISYEGQLIKPDNSPVNGVATEFKFQIRSPAPANCLLYEEKQVRNLSGTGGNFAVAIGDGSGLVSTQLVSRNSAAPVALSLNQVFENSGTFDFSAGDCTSSTTYAPNTGDGRNLVVLFKDPATMAGWEPLPAQMITFAPFAIESQNSQKFAGLEASQYLRSGDGTSFSPLSNTQYTALTQLIAGNSTVYSKSNQLNGLTLPSLMAGQALGWNGSTWIPVTPVASNAVTNLSNPSGSITLSPVSGSGSVIVNSGASSLSTSTGALVVSGGAGVSGAMNVGGTMTAPNYIASNLGTVASPAYSMGGAGGTGLYSPSVNSVGVATGSTERMKIDSNGLVGINSAPVTSNRLYVYQSGSGSINSIFGQSTASSSGTAIGVHGDAGVNAGSGSAVYGLSGTATVTSGSAAAAAGGVFESIVSGGSAGLNAGIRISTVSGGSNNYGLYINNVTGTNSYSIYAPSTSAPSFFGGNVGIGTTAPVARVDLASSDSTPYNASSASSTLPALPILRLSNTASSTNTQTLINLQASNGTTNQNAYLGLVSSTSGTSPVFVIGQQTASTAYQERFRINETGNVGIGTTAPASMLDVSGTISASQYKLGNAVQPASGTCNVASSSVTTTPTDYACTASGGQATIPSGSAVTCTAVSNLAPGYIWSSTSNSFGNVRLFATGPFTSTFICMWMHP